ncbi:hypothetical protein JCM10908_002100 [Rhodotorula pacifica]|uniref:nuclear speckle splicing regulatory family 1 protein n=1 Tax=Rhodotorula pacifica TaxID=1495444 RepID=UPI00316FEC6A
MSGPPKLSFGLNKAQPPRQPVKRALPGKSAFGGAGADDDDDEPIQLPAHLDTARAKNRPGVSTATLSKAKKAQQQAEVELDKSVYEYDEVYDNMKAAEKSVQEARKQESADRKPKYINRLLETAELRKQDRLRAEDKMIAREREREGDEFADKDQFVTPAYLAQQEELRKIEEEEKKREEAERAKKGAGMTSFLKNYLDSTEAVHAAAVAATSTDAPRIALGPQRPTEKEKTDAELAAEVEAQTGRKIEINDEGEIIDRRQLMTGGLNVVKPKTSSSAGFAVPIAARTAARSARDGSSDPSNKNSTESLLHPGLSAAERARQSRERHSREVERQMLALEEKRKREAEEQLEQKVQKVAKRNDDDRVAQLKKAAEERRKKRLEEAAASKAAS